MEELSTPTMRERLNLALQAKKITPKPGPRGDGFEVELIEEDGDDKMLVDVDDLTPYGEEWTLTLRIAVGVDDGEAAERAAQLVERMTSAEEWKADRDLFEDGSNAVDLIWSALDAAGVQDGVDTREMVQVSEDEADVIGEYQQADVLERVGFLVDDRDALVAQVAALEARIVRMAKTLHEEADTGEAYARQMSFEPLSTAAMRRVVYLRAVADGGAS